ncbi:MAG: Mrp/NBP35 family ATP-binding protein [Proteobacteria bacterium]|nr:Mrp/NBP35 family ATP-binding protein [Pseudomonadota bacterium]
MLHSHIDKLLNEILSAHSPAEQALAVLTKTHLIKHAPDAKRHKWRITLDGSALNIQEKAQTEAFFLSHQLSQPLRDHLKEAKLSVLITFSHQQPKQSPKTYDRFANLKHQPSLTEKSKPRPLQHIAHIYCVASGKGGVGKSSVAMSIALLLAQAGKQVGLLDADIHGPSAPTLLGTSPQGAMEVRSTLNHNQEMEQRIVPRKHHGIKCVSFGFLSDTDQPVMWRGPMISKALDQFLFSTEWGKLDYLIIDLPPGTGDIPMSLAENVALDGIWIVTTAHPIALIDAQKAISMFYRLHIPVIGIIGNMLQFTCSHCKHTSDIFGSMEALHHLCSSHSLPLSAQIPLLSSSHTQKHQPRALWDNQLKEALSEVIATMAENT